MGLPFTVPFPPSYWKPNRVDLIVKGRYDERPAIAACKVGSLIMDDGLGNAQPHNVAGARSEKTFVYEHRLEGGIGSSTPVYAWDDYAIGTTVSFFYALPGDVFMALMANNYAYTAGVTLLTSAGDGTLMPLPANGMQNAQLYESVAESAAITNTTVATAFSPTYTIPANFLQAGDVLRIRAQALCASTHSTDTLVLTLKIGTTTIIATGAVDVANNDVGLIEAELTIRTIGASGTFIANGVWDLGVPGTATARAFNLGSTAIDTTATQAVSVFATWSVADATNQVTLSQLEVNLQRSTSYAAVAIAEDTLDLTTTSTTTTQPAGTFVPSSIPPYNAIRVRAL